MKTRKKQYLNVFNGNVGIFHSPWLWIIKSILGSTKRRVRKYTLPNEINRSGKINFLDKNTIIGADGSGFVFIYHPRDKYLINNKEIDKYSDDIYSTGTLSADKKHFVVSTFRSKTEDQGYLHWFKIKKKNNDYEISLKATLISSSKTALFRMEFAQGNLFNAPILHCISYEEGLVCFILRHGAIEQFSSNISKNQQWSLSSSERYVVSLNKTSWSDGTLLLIEN